MTIIFDGKSSRDEFMKRRQLRRDCFANQVWKKWVERNQVTNCASCVADESKRGFRRERFEKWLMENGCYLEVKNGVPDIKGFDEESLIMFTLRFG